MEIEDVTGIRFTSRRPAENQRQLTIRLSLLREIVIDDEDVLALPHEVLAERRRCVRCDVLHRRRIGRIRSHDDRVVHRPVLTQRLHHATHLTSPLTDRAVDTDDVSVLLVDDRVHRDGRLARPAVADDQLALSTTNRNHRIDGLDARLHRLADRLPLHNARRHDVDLARAVDPVDRSVSILRLTQRVDDSAEVPRPDRDIEHAARPTDLVALVEARPVTHDNRADVVLFEVQRERGNGVTGG